MENRDDYVMFEKAGENNNFTLDYLLPYRVYELQPSEEDVNNPIKFLEGAFLNKKGAEDFIYVKSEVEPEKKFLLENVWEVQGLDPEMFKPPYPLINKDEDEEE